MSGANVSPIGRNNQEWLVQSTDYRKLNEPPRPRLQRNGTIYLMARPPLLCQGSLPRRGLRLCRRLSQTPVSSGRLVGNAQLVRRATTYLANQVTEDQQSATPDSQCLTAMCDQPKRSLRLLRIFVRY